MEPASIIFALVSALVTFLFVATVKATKDWKKYNVQVWDDDGWIDTEFTIYRKNMDRAKVDARNVVPDDVPVMVTEESTGHSEEIRNVYK